MIIFRKECFFFHYNYIYHIIYSLYIFHFLLVMDTAISTFLKLVYIHIQVGSKIYAYYEAVMSSIHGVWYKVLLKSRGKTSFFFLLYLFLLLLCILFYFFVNVNSRNNVVDKRKSD